MENQYYKHRKTDQLYTRLLEVQSQTQLPLRCRISNFDPIKTGVREHCVRPIPAQDDIVNLEGVQRYAACFITSCKLLLPFSRTVRGLVTSKRIVSLAGKLAVAQKMAKYNVVFVLGGPGAGKGTQCENIVRDFGFVHLSAGDLLREERQRPGSKYGEEIEGHIKNGSIVPVQITCSLLRRAMEQSGKDRFLIDGFPRNKDNLDGWNEAMTGVADVKMVLFFNCSEQVCIDRCLDRGKTSGRSDDNLESLKKRIHTYTSSTMPIIDHYRALNLVQEMNGEKTPDEVFADVKKALESFKL